MTDNNKKWYNSFAFYPLIFICAIYTLASTIIFKIYGNTPDVFILTDIISFFLMGGFLYLIKKKYPCFEIFALCGAGIILVGVPMLAKTFCLNYAVSTLGVILFFLIFHLCNKININIKKRLVEKLDIIKFFKKKKYIDKKKKISLILYSFHIFLLIMIFLISSSTPSALTQLILYPPILLIAGIIIAYITQKIPVLYMLISCVVFYIPVRLVFIQLGFTFEALKFLYNFFVILGYYYFSGAIIGYGLYKKFNYVTKLEKFSVKNFYDRSIREKSKI